METEEFVRWLGATWRRVKRSVQIVADNNFNSWEDFIFFVALFGGFIVILVTFMGSAYNIGYDRGETDGLKRGFENGAKWIQPGK